MTKYNYNKKIIAENKRGDVTKYQKSPQKQLTMMNWCWLIVLGTQKNQKLRVGVSNNNRFRVSSSNTGCGGGGEEVCMLYWYPYGDRRTIFANAALDKDSTEGYEQ